VEGNDLTLLYGANTDENQSLLTVTERRKFLPSEIYAKLVQDTVVCCVDIVLVRTNADGTKQCLLVERSSEPVKGVWWFPGGRLLKGETFFDAGKSLCLEYNAPGADFHPPCDSQPFERHDKKLAFSG
jgi:hypothetical protein